MAPDKLTTKFGTGLDLSLYKGFYYQEVLPDINYIADSIAADPLVDSVQVLDSLKALIWITKDNYILKFGEKGLDPDDGEYCGFLLYMLPIPAPYLPIYPDYPKDKPEIMSYRTPYSRTFKNDDATYTTILTIRPTSYPVIKGDRINWIDISPDEPIPDSILWILRDQYTCDVTYYASVVELDNDGLDAYNFIYGAKNRAYVNVGAGRDDAGIHKHLYQRECSQFSTTGFPPHIDEFTEVRYKTYITNAYPETYQINPDGTYDYYEIWPYMRHFYHKISDYSNGNYNDLYTDIGDGTVYYSGGSYIWGKGDGTVYADFNSSGIINFAGRYDDGWYSTGLKDYAETGNSNPLYWEAIVVMPSSDRLYVTYSLVTFWISGYVRTPGGAGIGGVTMNGLPGNPVTYANGYYDGEVSYGWSGTVTPQKSGYTFVPPSNYYSSVYQNYLNQNYTGYYGAINEEVEVKGQPEEFSLLQNFPNPVVSRTVIKYAVPKKSKVELKVYDAIGREIATLLNKEQKAGHYQATWDIRDVSKNKLPNGIYFYRLKAGNFTETRKMVIVR